MFSYDDVVQDVCLDEKLEEICGAEDVLAGEVAADGPWLYRYWMDGRYVMVDCGSEEVYRFLQRSDWRERRQRERRSRCLVSDASGSVRRCTGRCGDCARFRSGRFVSLEGLLEEDGWLPADPDDGVSDVLARVMMDDLVGRLGRIKPVYGLIFRMLYDGMPVAEIARRLGRPRKTVEYWVRKVREEAQKWVKRGDVDGLW